MLIPISATYCQENAAIYKDVEAVTRDVEAVARDVEAVARDGQYLVQKYFLVPVPLVFFKNCTQVPRYFDTFYILIWYFLQYL